MQFLLLGRKSSIPFLETIHADFDGRAGREHFFLKKMNTRIPIGRSLRMALVELPDDIMRHVIFPFISKGDRFELNRALPRTHRVLGKLGKRVLEFELLFLVYRTKRAIDSCIEINDMALKRTAIVDWLRSYKTYSILFQYSYKIRSHFIDRVNFLIDEDQSVYKTDDYVTELKILRDEIFGALVREYPYKYELVHRNGKLPSY